MTVLGAGTIAEPAPLKGMTGRGGRERPRHRLKNMSTDYVVRILREGLVLGILLSAGPLAAAMITALVVALMQATTSVQEQTLSLLPKLIAVSLTFLIVGPWMLTESVKFIQLMFEAIALIR